MVVARGRTGNVANRLLGYLNLSPSGHHGGTGDTSWLLAILLLDTWRIGKLTVQRFAVLDTAAEELRPIGDFGDGRPTFRQQGPQIGMMPAEVLSRGVAVFANGGAEAFHLMDEGGAVHAGEVVIRFHSLRIRRSSVQRRGTEPLTDSSSLAGS